MSQDISEKLGLGKATHHIFLCANQTKAKCVGRETTLEVWAYLKRRLIELGLHASADSRGPAVQRSKVDCLRICEQGPICVIYPEGIWYRSVSCEVMERILVEHISCGKPVQDFILCEAPLRSNEEDQRHDQEDRPEDQR